MTFSALESRPVALLLVGITPTGEDDWRVLHGFIRQDSPFLLFDRGSKGPPVPIQDGWLERFKAVSPHQAKILAPAEFYLSLRVGPLPEDADLKDYVATGIRIEE